jgi:hypothetical protein
MRWISQVNAWQIFQGSDGARTTELYAHLETLGSAGVICLNLFRACKCSGRAKSYRTNRHRHEAYGRKDWSLANLCTVLAASAATHRIVWGWKLDPAQHFHRWVLYVEIPTGQVSFHTERRHCDQDYPGEWDGQRLSAERVIRWTALLLNEAPLDFEAATRPPLHRPS